jgi:hypothetical protein
MNDGQEHKDFPIYLVLMGVLLLIALIYLGIVFYNRHAYEREVAEKAKAAEIERNRDAVELNGGSALKITGLTLDPGTIRRGKSSQLCYGVINAKEIRFEPAVESVWPSRLRCVDVSPAKTTTYRLTATGENGKTEEAEITLQVR